MFLEPGTSVFAPAIDGSLELALDDYLDSVGEAEMAMEHISRMRDMLKGMDSLSDRGLKFVRISLEGWGNYLKIPSQCRPSLEGRGKDNLSLALEESEGFFASIWEGIKNIFKWISNTFKKLFGMDEDGDGGGGSGSDTAVSNAIDAMESNPAAVVENTKKKGGEKGAIEIASFKVFGVTSGKFTHDILSKKIDEVHSNLKKLKGFAIPASAVVASLTEPIKRAVSTEDAPAEAYKELLAGVRKATVDLEAFFSNADFPTAPPDLASSLGTDEGKVYMIPIIADTIGMLVKFSGGDLPKMNATQFNKIPDNAISSVSTGDLDNNAVSRLRHSMETTWEEMYQLTNSSKDFFKKVNETNQTIEKAGKKQLASAAKEQKDFVSSIHSVSTSLANIAKLFAKVTNAARRAVRMSIDAVDVRVEAKKK